MTSVLTLIGQAGHCRGLAGLPVQRRQEAALQARESHLQRLLHQGEARVTIRLKVSSSAFTFKTLLRYYAKQAPKHGKKHGEIIYGGTI